MSYYVSVAKNSESEKIIKSYATECHAANKAFCKWIRALPEHEQGECESRLYYSGPFIRCYELACKPKGWIQDTKYRGFYRPHGRSKECADARKMFNSVRMLNGSDLAKRLFGADDMFFSGMRVLSMGFSMSGERKFLIFGSEEHFLNCVEKQRPKGLRPIKASTYMKYQEELNK